MRDVGIGWVDGQLDSASQQIRSDLRGPLVGNVLKFGA